MNMEQEGQKIAHSRYNLNENNFHLLGKLQDELYYYRNVRLNFHKAFDRATSMGYDVIKVPRKEGVGYYLFIKDSFQNLYEIKEKG